MSTAQRVTNTAVGVVLVLVFLAPVYWMINVSLQSSAALLRTPPAWFPADPTWSGYAEAVRTQGDNLLTSLVIALGTVVFTLLVSAPAAYALARFRLRGTMALVLVVLLVQMVPGIVMANSLYPVFSQLGLLDSYVGMILADSTLTVPFAVLILRTFMSGVPKELIEAGYVDGAGQWRTFGSVVVPVCRNALITAGLFSFLFAWADFLFAVSFTTGNTLQPITVGIYRFVGNQTTNWNGVMATAVLASIPAAILLLTAQRYVAAGITGGGVKD